MITLSYGELPHISVLEKGFPAEGYRMEMQESDPCWEVLTGAVNQGIDAHLEAIQFTEFKGQYGKRGVCITDAKSLYTFLRRLIESESQMPIYDENPPALDLASAILDTMGVEWI